MPPTSGRSSTFGARPPPPSAETAYSGRTREVASQAPTTYVRHLSKPRFKVLAECAWG